MSAELMKSEFVRRLSSVRRSSSARLCSNYLWTLVTDCFQILGVASPGPYTRILFEFFEKKNCFDFYE